VSSDLSTDMKFVGNYVLKGGDNNVQTKDIKNLTNAVQNVTEHAKSQIQQSLAQRQPGSKDYSSEFRK